MSFAGVRNIGSRAKIAIFARLISYLRNFFDKPSKGLFPRILRNFEEMSNGRLATAYSRSSLGERMTSSALIIINL